MSRFAPALRRVAAELDLPRNARAAILMEMAADMEALHAHHLARGHTDDEARRRAEEAVLGSPEVVRRLCSLHGRGWRDWSAETGKRLSAGVDLLMMVLGVFPVLAIAAVLGVQELAGAPTHMLWVILLLGVLLTVSLVREAARLARGMEVGRRGLPHLLVLTLLAPTAGLLSFVQSLSAAAAELASAAGESDSSLVLAGYVASGGSSFLLGLLLGISGALAWFLLVSRSSLRISREVDEMLRSPHAPGPTEAAEVLPLVRRRSS